MKAEQLHSTRSSNRNSFYSYRRRTESSPSVCSSASSSAISAPASGPSRSTRNQSKKAGSKASAVATRQAPKRRDSLPPASTSTGQNREFESLIEREYQDDVLAYMAEMESMTQANVELIDQQPELQWYMRPYLVDFLIEIHSQYRLRPETLYLAVNLADRYTSKRIVYKRHYQLVGCAALWIAAKFEDQKDRVPTVQDLVAMTCNAYDASAFIQMEGHVLSTLGWLIGHPTAEAWLRSSAIAQPSMLSGETKLQNVARMLMEITLFHRSFVAVKPSDIAKGCLLLSRFLCGKARKIDSETSMAVEVAHMLDSHLAQHLDQLSTILIKKYALESFGNVSAFVRQSYLSGIRFSLAAWPQPILPTTMLTPTHFPLRRKSSSVSSCVSSSPSSYGTSPGGVSSTDDDDLPLTPCTPMSQHRGGEEEADPFARHPSLSKLMNRQRMSAHDGSPLNLTASNGMALCSSPLPTVHEREVLSPTKVPCAKVQVNIVPASGSPMPLY